jgi:hypothetical protein
MPSNNWDTTTPSDRPEIVITDEVNGTYAKVTPNSDVQTSDIVNNGGISKELSVISGTPQELKVGATVLANRKYIILQPLDTGFKWGFSSSAIYFELFKFSTVILPVGANTTIWIACDSSTKTIVIGEIA